MTQETIKRPLQSKLSQDETPKNGVSNGGFEDRFGATMTKRSPSRDDGPMHGCVELGRDAGQGNLYCTRYRIDHSGQRSNMCQDLMKEECCPCSGAKAHRSCWSMTWAILRSEAFLFSLHMTALVLGVVKEAGNYREDNEVLHLVHSVVETFVSMLLISVRVASCWTAFYHIKKGASKIENLPDKGEERKKHHIQGHSLRRWLIMMTSLGVLLELYLVTTFLCLYFEAHLGWTILTNQLALVLMSMASSLYMARVESAESVIREDQHKAVLYEATMLLRELFEAATDPQGSPQHQQHLIHQVETFCKALRDTELFEQPGHIYLDGRHKAAQSLTFNAMMQSSV